MTLSDVSLVCFAVSFTVFFRRLQKYPNTSKVGINSNIKIPPHDLFKTAVPEEIELLYCIWRN